MDLVRSGNHTIRYIVRYTKRKKTFAIRVVGSHLVEVLSPRGLPKGEVERVVAKKAEWIHKRSRCLRARPAGVERYGDGDRVLFLGEEIPILIDRAARRKSARVLTAGGRALSIPECVADRRGALVRLYTREARAIIGERVGSFAPLMGVRPRKVLVKANRSNWGSCTSKDTLNFSYRLIMAPMEIVDYIVVHELAHLVVRGHPKAFWDTVERYVPEVKASRRWLRENAAALSL